MPVLGIAAVRVGLFAIFGVAVWTKATDQRAFQTALANFGVDARLVRPLAVAVPIVEFVTAVFLLRDQCVREGAALALGLLLAFTGAIVINLANGRTPDCRCFGRLSRGRIGMLTVARNAVLAIPAFWLFRVTVEAPAWADAVTAMRNAVSLRRSASSGAALGVLVVIVAAETLLVVLLFLQHGKMLLRLDALESRVGIGTAGAIGLPIGAPLPDFSLATLAGGVAESRDLRNSGSAAVFIFTDRGCSHCHSLGPKIATWQRQLTGTVRLFVFAKGTADENHEIAKVHGLTDVVLHPTNDLPDAFAVHAVPAAVLVRANGTIGSATAVGGDAVVRLVDRLAAAAIAGTLDSEDGSGERRDVPALLQST